VSPESTCRWLMTRELSTAERTSWPTPVPYSTCEVEGRFVVQLMVAPERVRLLTEMPVASGAMAVGTLLGVLVEVGTSVAMAVGVRVSVAVASAVAVLVRVGVRVGVDVGVKSSIRMTAVVADGVGDGEGGPTVAVAVASAVAVTNAVRVGVGVPANVGVSVGAGLAVDVEVGVDVLGAGCALLTSSQSGLALAPTISTASAPTSARRPNTECSECHPHPDVSRGRCVSAATRRRRSRF
jgi:hypothetical protein